MQRDVKVGMAVGVALVGIVGALFFRREPEARDKDAAPPRLQDVEEIDRRIVEKPRGPYMNGVEDFPDQAAPVPPPRGPSSKPKPQAADHDETALTKRDEKSREPTPAGQAPGAVPEPVQPIPTESLAADNVPPHNRAWEPAGPGPKKAGDGKRSNSPGTAGAGRTHVIRPGDTLSGLASQYLGSSARYREIYEANRKVLRSPDDLPDGATLVIPDTGKPQDSHQAPKIGAGAAPPTVKGRTTASRGAESETDEPSTGTAPRGDATPGKLRFVPVKRGPFSAGRSQPSSESPRSDDNR